MTIAMCYLSPEGVVLGADSTASISVQPGGFHFFNHNQKLFEIGEGGTLAALTWGLGGLGAISYRTLLAELADDIEANPPADVQDVATRWATKIWNIYSSHPELLPAITLCRTLAAKPAHDPNANPPNPAARTDPEEKQFLALKLQLQVGFCIAGYVLPARPCSAWEVIVDPVLTAAPVPVLIPPLNQKFWGAPNVIQRLVFGVDAGLRKMLLDSGKWGGTHQELDAITQKLRYDHVILPIRDAIDFVYACIYSTVKALKFSNNSQICGGPIEIAVITTDRRFRWVRHKDWDVAIEEGIV